MSIGADFWNFFWSVVFQWQAFITGGILAAIIQIIERRRGKNLSWPMVRRLFIFYVVLAGFLAWREERVKLDKFIDATSDAQPLTLDQEQRMRAVLAGGKGSSVVLAAHSTDRKGQEFAQRIRSAFTQSGWGVGGSGPISGGSGRSLRILAEDVNTKPVGLITAAFNAANLRYRVFRVCQGGDITVEIGESEVEKSPAAGSLR